MEWYDPLLGLNEPYDRVYLSKVFGLLTPDYGYPVYADEIIRGGTGYGLKHLDTVLPVDVETAYPDYSLYGITDTAYGFLTRGCPRQCGFCCVSNKEGCVSHKVANLDAFWKGQREIKLLDPNLLACQNREDLLLQLIDSGARVDFTQGLDIRLMNNELTDMLMRCKIKMIHFAWDREAESEFICRKLREFKRQTNIDERKARVYILTNYNTPFAFDLYRVYELRSMGYDPYVMIYDKEHATRQYKMLQRWVNNKFIFRTVERFEDYRPKVG